jgi:ribonuclease R
MADDTSKILAQFQQHPDGFGFCIPDDAALPDVFIPRHRVGHAMHRDLVVVRVLPSQDRPHRRRSNTRQPGLEGEIIEVRVRHSKRIVGRFQSPRTGAYVTPDSDRLPFQVRIPDDGRGGAREGQAVVVELHGFPGDEGGPWGGVVQILGTRGEIATEIEAVMHHHGLPLEFPAPVAAEAEALQQRVTSLGVTGVLDEITAAGHWDDLQSIPFVTIDGESARDFDDAVAVETEPDGNFHVWIAIADVSAFVAPDSVLDLEARARGTSVYFPDRCLPMFPPVLADHLCSLRPDEPRLALVVDFRVDAAGGIGPPTFHRGMIKSRARLTYTQVQHRLDTGAPHDEPMLHSMAALCKIMRAQRLARGSIDFDLPEPEILLDIEGAPDKILKSQRLFAHQMIEELMIATNEQVAQFLTDRQSACLFRLHPKPKGDATRELEALLDHLGIDARLHHPPRSHELAAVVSAARGHPGERLVNHTVLRSMQQATYGTKNIGHFGLASTCYGHFTSPIRRYPDLLNHRLILQIIAPAVNTRTPAHTHLRTEDLQAIAVHVSRRERVALDAEREMLKLYAAAFLQGNQGDTFTGRVTHVTRHGFFVELDAVFVEGFVSKTALPRDRYELNTRTLSLEGRRTGRSFGLGDPVTVIVAEVKLEQRQIIFHLKDGA